MKASSLRLTIAVAMGAALGGCGSDMSDLETYVAEVKARESRDIEPIPQPKQFERFEYVPGDRPDPFVATQTDDRQMPAANALRPDFNRNREALEDFPLDSLSMTGTIRTAAGLFALVKAPDGVIHRVTLNNHMGQNYGEIVAITEAEVSLRELVPDGFGGWTQRQASLALAE